MVRVCGGELSLGMQKPGFQRQLDSHMLWKRKGLNLDEAEKGSDNLLTINRNEKLAKTKQNICTQASRWCGG